MPELPFDKFKPHPFRSAPAPPLDTSTPRHLDTSYVELAITTNFTFLTGAAHPEEFVHAAHALGHRAASIADTNTLAGIVRAHVAAKDLGIPLAIGSRLRFLEPVGVGGLDIIVYPTSRDAYSRLCRLLTLGKRRAPKGECWLNLPDLIEHHQGLLAIVAVLPSDPSVTARALKDLRETFDDDRLSLALCRRYGSDDEAELQGLAALADCHNIPLVAINDAHYHAPDRRALQDVLTCIRHGCTIHEAGFRLCANAERHLKPPDEMARLFAAYPRALARTVEIVERARAFNLDQLRYEYPVEECPDGLTPSEYLERRVWQGAAKRYGQKRCQGVEVSRCQGSDALMHGCLEASPSTPGHLDTLAPSSVRTSLLHELALIKELRYEPYFLTCTDIVEFARSQGILCQGRGGAANSAVCYCLGITEVDPAKFSLLFERFISRERKEPPDIDIDFEHERREEVIQHIYEKYGRDRAALTAEVISYRGRSAVRDVGKAMGLSLDCVDAMAKHLDLWGEPPTPERIREAGLNPADPTLALVIDLTRQLVGFPRHLSQHVGGFVITRSKLCDLVPIENATMDDRTVIEWDKDDIDAMGMLKIDVLGLGMLTCLRKCIDLAKVSRCQGAEVSRETGPGHSSAASAPLRENSGASRRGAESAEAMLDEPEGLEESSRGQSEGRQRRPSAAAGMHAPHRWHPERVQYDDPSQFVPSRLSEVPWDDPAVYEMIQHADTIGVFQIESRAQMSMLPRLKPATFYDLVIEVAIVRPGPIQGGMVHPYLKRREGKEPVVYPSPEIKAVLERTLGVPLFQEQAMQLAIVAAGFTADEADKLRRAMAAWKRKGDLIYRFGEKLISGMLKNGYPRDFAERCFEQIKGFSEYGFPESHAASFALLVYASAWFKRHHPAAFAAALINSQPMGFYQPAQIVRDAREHGVEVRGVDVNHSEWDCTLEEKVSRCRGVEVSREYSTKEMTCGNHSLVPGPDRLAEEQGTCEEGLHRDREDAALGTLRTHVPDEAIGGIHSLEHRGGVQPQDATGVHSRASNRERAPSGTLHAMGDRDRTGNGSRRFVHCRPDRRNRPHALRPDQQVGEVKPHQRLTGTDAFPSTPGHLDTSTPSVSDAFPSTPRHLDTSTPCLRLGLRLIKGLKQSDADRIAAAVRNRGPFSTIESLWRASGASAAAFKRLAQADAFRSMSLDAQRALWQVRPLKDEALPLFESLEPPTDREGLDQLPPIKPGRQVLQDYHHTGLSLKAHPLSFLRSRLDARSVIAAAELRDPRLCPQGREVQVAGIVLVRQRPSTASGVVFITLEDETGIANLVIWRDTFERFRIPARLSAILLVRGRIERQGEVVHVHAAQIESLDYQIPDLAAASRDFH